ncbi:MAG: hypothetical protein PHW34_08380 [Hespellia sp.]|nr:hypothetical protein [Hespellia sp.]
MNLVMNEKDKNHMLNTLLTEQESYKATIWGTIMADAKDYMKWGTASLVIGSGAAMGGALSNAYCYVGITNKHLNFVVVDSFDVTKEKQKFSIFLEDISKVKVKNGFVPGRKVIYLYNGKKKIKLALMSHAMGAKLEGQAEGVKVVCESLRNL